MTDQQARVTVTGDMPEMLKIIAGTTHYNNIKAILEKYNHTLEDIEGLTYSQSMVRDVVREEETGFLWVCKKPAGRPIWDIRLKGGKWLACYGDSE